MMGFTSAVEAESSGNVTAIASGSINNESISRKRIATAVESAGTFFGLLKTLEAYSLPTVQLAAKAIISIRITACIIVAAFIAGGFIFNLPIQRQKQLKRLNMKYFVILLTTFVFAIGAKAQTAEDSVKAVINQLFDAMRGSDPVKLRDAFADSAILQTIGRTREGQTRIVTDGVDKFAASISKLPKDSADERITFDIVKIDGPLAIAWTPYKFYFNGKFSHCGVNSFQCVRINGRWKIQYLIDTRRRVGCE
jgi:hypothetical protein